MNEDKYENLTIDYIDRPTPKSHPDFVMRIGWSCPQLGFGTVDFMWHGNELHADTEYMGPAFLKKLLMLLSQQIKITE